MNRTSEDACSADDDQTRNLWLVCFWREITTRRLASSRARYFAPGGTCGLSNAIQFTTKGSDCSVLLTPQHRRRIGRHHSQWRYKHLSDGWSLWGRSPPVVSVMRYSSQQKEATVLFYWHLSTDCELGATIASGVISTCLMAGRSEVDLRQWVNGYSTHKKNVEL